MRYGGRAYNTVPPDRRILVHIEDAQSAHCRLTTAQVLARPLDADLLACYCVTSTAMRHPLQVGLALRGIEECEREDGVRSGAAYEAFRKACGREPGCNWLDWPGDPEALFVRQALYSDYLVLQQPDWQDAQPNVPSTFIEHVLVHSGKPAFVLPRGTAILQLPRTVAIAWTETREAARAVASAMPFLRDARKVHVMGRGEDACSEVPALAGRLEEQGVHVELHYLEGAGAHAGHAVAERATGLGADLLVMGSYGHGPTRELLVGGVFRTVLARMPLPVLMAH